MKHLKITLLLCLGLFSNAIIGQSEVFEADVKKFIKLSNESNWDAVIDMMHPNMFKSVPKEQMSKMMNQMNAMGLKTKIELKGITQVSKSIKSGADQYQKFDYDVNIVLTLNDQLWAQKDFLLNAIKSNFGGKNLKLDEATKQISMDGTQSMLAIKDNAATVWKYLNFQGENDPLVKSAIPAEVFEQIVK